MPATLVFSPFLQVKAGSATPAVFIVHGLSGTVQVGELVRQIQSPHPIFGVQAQGIDGVSQPLHRIEDMAALYLSALADLRPSDSYILIGYSFGGLVALEMAQRLLQSGHPAALLVLVDAFPHPRFMPFSQRVPLFAKRMMLHARQISRLPALRAISYFVTGLKRRLHLTRTRSGSLDRPDSTGLSAEQKLEQAILARVREASFTAYANYRPKFYPGNIRFIATAEKTFFPDDPAKIWTPLAANLTVETIPGHHLNIVTTECEPLAALLTRYIEQATSHSPE